MRLEALKDSLTFVQVRGLSLWLLEMELRYLIAR
jgi:hypothetical protein